MKYVDKLNKVVQLLAPQQITSATNSSALDLSGFEGVLLVAHFGNISTGGSVAVKVQESDDGSTWADATMVSGGGTADANNKVIVASYGGGKKYIRLVLTPSDSATAYVGVVAVLQDARHLPV